MTLPAGQKLTAEELNGQFWSMLTILGEADTVAALETTALTTFTNLSTVGPTVSKTSHGTKAWVFLGANMFGTTSTATGHYMSVDVSGATTIAAADSNSLRCTSSNAGTGFDLTRLVVLDITPGMNVYTAKYKVFNLTGSWRDRSMLVFAP